MLGEHYLRCLHPSNNNTGAFLPLQVSNGQNHSLVNGEDPAIIVSRLSQQAQNGQGMASANHQLVTSTANQQATSAANQQATSAANQQATSAANQQAALSASRSEHTAADAVANPLVSNSDVAGLDDFEIDDEMFLTEEVNTHVYARLTKSRRWLSGRVCTSRHASV